MNTYKLLAASLGLATFAACNEPRGVTEPPPGAAPGEIVPSAAAPHDDLARRIARALENPAFRAYVRAQLGASPFPERKLQLQEFLQAHEARALRVIGAANSLAASVVQAEAARAVPLEFYMPVPEHRAAWTGDDRILVATALRDGDAPVAFDPAGRRHQLRADRPPATPVLAVVPVETDFRPAICQDCGGGPENPPAPPPPPPSGLYLTASHLEQDFEGWLKGSPEIEFHVLGQKGASDTLMSYQCAAATQSAPYAFDQNALDWSGSVLLFSKPQLDAYNAAHPNKNVRIFGVEDDDGPCDIRTDRKRLEDLLRAIDNAHRSLTAGNDSGSVFRRAGALQRVFTALASWIKSNDDPIGNAVEDAVVGIYVAGYNWHLKGDNNITNGRIRLEMR